MGAGHLVVLFCRAVGAFDGGLESQACRLSHCDRVRRCDSDPDRRGPQELWDGVVTCI